MYVYRCKILRVVDGDTIDVEIDLGFSVKVKERVRLANIDTPEMFGPNATPEGKAATEFVRQWVEEKTSQPGFFMYHSLKYDRKDKYGRALGEIVHLSVDGECFLCDDLKANGHIKQKDLFCEE